MFHGRYSLYCHSSRQVLNVNFLLVLWVWDGVGVKFVGLGSFSTRNALDRSDWFWNVHSGILVSELTDLRSIGSKFLLFLTQSDLEEWNSVQDKQQDGGDNERPQVDSTASSQLVSELLVVVVEPSTSTAGTEVSSNDVVGSEKTSQNRTSESSHTVETPDVQTIVNTNEVLDVDGEVTGKGGQDTDWNGEVDWDETGSWVVKEHPSKTTTSSSQVGVHTGVETSDGGISRGSTVESKPSEPQEHSSQNNTGDRVRSVLWQAGASNRVVSLTANQGVSKGTETRSLVDWSSASKVVSTQGSKPSVGVPCPHSNWAVDNGHPAEQEHHHRSQSSSLASTTEHDASGNHGEHTLEKAEDNIRKSSSSVVVSQDLHQTEVIERTQEDRRTSTEG